jgi:hypothetical protein
VLPGATLIGRSTPALVDTKRDDLKKLGIILSETSKGSINFLKRCFEVG